VAEDQIYIAMDLALAIEDAGGSVVGPAASAAEALELLANTNVDAAILDVDLLDGDCSAVVEVLAGRRIPIIIHTGVGLPPLLTARFPNLIVHHKPCMASRLVAELESMIVSGGAAPVA
jgi:DNA-binding NtrC family response regulator